MKPCSRARVSGPVHQFKQAIMKIHDLFNKELQRLKREVKSGDKPEDSQFTKLKKEFAILLEFAEVLKEKIGQHPQVNYFWVFENNIDIGFHPDPHEVYGKRLYMKLCGPGEKTHPCIFGGLAGFYETEFHEAQPAIRLILKHCYQYLDDSDIQSDGF
jgi:hypothetical protein